MTLGNTNSFLENEDAVAYPKLASPDKAGDNQESSFLGGPKSPRAPIAVATHVSGLCHHHHHLRCHSLSLSLSLSLLDDHTHGFCSVSRSPLVAVLLLAPPPPHHDSSPEGGGEGEGDRGRDERGEERPTTKAKEAGAAAAAPPPPPHAIVKTLSHSPSVVFFFSLLAAAEAAAAPALQHPAPRPSPLRSPFKVSRLRRGRRRSLCSLLLHRHHHIALTHSLEAPAAAAVAPLSRVSC